MLDYPLTDVLDLMQQHLDHARRTRQREKGSKTKPVANNEEVVYRQAGDDWF